jgi:hypothetical protein
LIKSLISCQCHSMLISYSHQKKASFWGIYCNLPNNLIKTLAKQFFSNGAYPLISCLSMLKCFIKLLFESNYIWSFRFMMRDILHVVLSSFIFPISRHYHIVKDICINESSYPMDWELDLMLFDYFLSSSIL